MFIALRRFTLVCTIVLERVMLNKMHDKSTVGAIAVMVGGVPCAVLCHACAQDLVRFWITELRRAPSLCTRDIMHCALHRLPSGEVSPART